MTVSVTNTCAACGCAIILEFEDGVPASYLEFFERPGGNPTCSLCFAKKRAKENQEKNNSNKDKKKKKQPVSQWKRVEPS